MSRARGRGGKRVGIVGGSAEACERSRLEVPLWWTWWVVVNGETNVVDDVLRFSRFGFGAASGFKSCPCDWLKFDYTKVRLIRMLNSMSPELSSLWTYLLQSLQNL